MSNMMENEFTYKEIEELLRTADEAFRVPKEISAYMTAKPCPAHVYAHIIDTIIQDEDANSLPYSGSEKSEFLYAFQRQLFLSLGAVTMAYWYFKEESDLDMFFEYSSSKYLSEKLSGGTETAEFFSMFLLKLEDFLSDFKPFFRRFSLDELNRKVSNFYLIVDGSETEKMYLYEDNVNVIFTAMDCPVRLRFKRRSHPRSPMAEFIFGVTQERRYEGYPKNYSLRLNPEFLISAYSIPPGTVSSGQCINSKYDNLGEVLIREEQIAKILELRKLGSGSGNGFEELLRLLFRRFLSSVNSSEIERMSSDSVFFFRQPERYCKSYKQADVDFDQALRMIQKNCTELDIIDDIRNASRTLDGFAGHLDYLLKGSGYSENYFQVLSLIYVMDNCFTITPGQAVSFYTITTITNLALILHNGKLIDFSNPDYNSVILERISFLTEFLTKEYDRVYSNIVEFLYTHCRYKVDNFIFSFPEYVEYKKIYPAKPSELDRLDGGKIYHHLMLSMFHPFDDYKVNDLIDILHEHYLRIINKLAEYVFEGGRQFDDAYAFVIEVGKILYSEICRQFDVAEPENILIAT